MEGVRWSGVYCTRGLELSPRTTQQQLSQAGSKRRRLARQARQRGPCTNELNM